MYYEFLTSIGMFRIQVDQEEPERVILSIDNILIGKYESPEAAARAVYAQQTGWERWDFLREISGPRDLSEW
jgi:hypothetical protein